MTNQYTLHYVPILIRLKCCETASLPPCLGSILHGVIGWALTNYDVNLYRYLYENGKENGYDIVKPYILEPPLNKGIYQENDELAFQFILLGDGAQFTRDFIRALVETRYFYLGSERKKFELLEMIQVATSHVIWNKEKDTYINPVHSMVLTNIDENINYHHFAMLLKTPLKIRRSGNLVIKPDFITIIRNITRRLIELTDRYGGYVNKEEAVRICSLAEQIQLVSCNTSIVKIERYSSRMHGKMDWSGIMGSMTCEGDMIRFIPWLLAAETLHLGRNITFGFGKVDVIFW